MIDAPEVRARSACRLIEQARDPFAADLDRKAALRRRIAGLIADPAVASAVRQGLRDGIAERAHARGGPVGDHPNAAAWLREFGSSTDGALPLRRSGWPKRGLPGLQAAMPPWRHAGTGAKGA